jgi:hypothetical protein
LGKLKKDTDKAQGPKRHGSAKTGSTPELSTSGRIKNGVKTD